MLGQRTLHVGYSTGRILCGSTRAAFPHEKLPRNSFVGSFLRIRKGCLSHEVVAQSIGDAGGRSGDGPMREIQEASHTGGLSTSDKESKPPRVGVTMLEASRPPPE